MEVFKICELFLSVPGAKCCHKETRSIVAIMLSSVREAEGWIEAGSANDSQGYRP